VAPDFDVYPHTLPAHPLEEIVRMGEAASFSKFSLGGHSNFLFKQRS
jgi:hypothetical protein